MVDYYNRRAHCSLMQTTTTKTKTTKRIAALTKQLTAMRKAGLSYDLPEVRALLAAINALCNAEVGQ